MYFLPHQYPLSKLQRYHFLNEILKRAIMGATTSAPSHPTYSPPVYSDASHSQWRQYVVSTATKAGHKLAEFKPQVLSTTLERETTFSTQLKLIEIPSREFFPMWQSHMDSLLQCGLDYIPLPVQEGALKQPLQVSN